MDKIKNELLKVDEQLQNIRLEEKRLQGYREGLQFLLKSSFTEIYEKVEAGSHIKISSAEPIIENNQLIHAEVKEDPFKAQSGPLSPIYEENEKIFQQVKYILSNEKKPVHANKLMKLLKVDSSNKHERKRFIQVLYTRVAAGRDLIKTAPLTFGLKGKDYDTSPRNWVTTKKENEQYFEKIKEVLGQSISPLSLSNLMSHLPIERNTKNKARIFNLMDYRAKKHGDIINMGQNMWGLKEKNYGPPVESSFVPIEKYTRLKYIQENI